MDFDKFINIRKYLHQHPELSGCEIETSKYISSLIKENCPSATIKTIAKTGLLVNFKGKDVGNHILLRSELDALPIKEANNFNYKSLNPDISHKCGHDGHMTILIAVAHHLQNYGVEKGEVSLLFQPAEEIGLGAKEVLKDRNFAIENEPNYVFALHNVPGYELNTVMVKKGVFTPSVISVKVQLVGKTSHAAEPENGINPSYALSKIIEEVKKMEIPDPNSELFRIITPIYITLGSEAFGTSAGEGEIGFTLRTLGNSEMNKFRESFNVLISKIAESENLKHKIEWLQEFKSVENNLESASIIKEVASQNGLEYEEMRRPFKWGEDFGLFTENYRGAMFALGAGLNTPALHNPDYDFPDELIKTGLEMFIKIIDRIQK